MSATNGTVLDIIELTKVFRDFWGRESVRALDGLDFEVRRGEVFGLLGPNGSGKTTTVRIVLGLLFPTRGAVSIFGRSPRSVEVKKRIGYMPEESHLYGYLNAEETLDFFGRLFRLPSGERNRRTDALIDMVGLQRARRRPIGQYSKGMARRIGLAQALINDPDLLILDEPTTGLDPIGTREMKDLILTLRERGKTILLCSHLLADVEEICDRICILYGGRQQKMGSVTELLSAEDTTQIRTPRLDEETTRRVIALIREAAGPETPVEVSMPTRNLEEYFLGVVEEARRERLATAGAERGTGAAAFLGGEADEGQRLLDDLVGAADVDASPQEAPAVQPADSLPAGDQRQVLDQLVQEAQGPSEGAGGAGSAGPEAAAASPETGVRNDVLDELVADSQDEATDEDQAG